MKNYDIPIVIDGPNFINRILDTSINKDIISNQLSFYDLRNSIKIALAENRIFSDLPIIEFVCSKKLFGNASKKFTQTERDTMLKRLMRERGVHIEEVNLPGSKEKGVDNMVSTKIETFSETFNYIILISNDRDYVPLLSKMRTRGKNVILVTLTDDTPDEVINESFLTINLSNQYECLFKYDYPHFTIYKDFTIDKYKEMISQADDRIHNQLRVSKTGYVFISKEVGNQNLANVKFRFETFMAGNGYVGPKAASDSEYIKDEYDELMLAWQNKDNVPDYIDVPVSVFVKK